MARLLVLLLAPVWAMRSTNEPAEGPARLTTLKGESAQEKLAAIWQNIMDDHEEPGQPPSKLAPLKLMAVATEAPWVGGLIKRTGLFEDLNATFSWRKDTPLPQKPAPAHAKLIHPVGSVAKVSLVWDEDIIKKMGYTGVFESRQDNALLRMGPAGPLKKEGCAPGIGLKIFRDNQESVNTVMLYSLRGQAGFNHFEHTLCNKLSDFRDKSFAEKLLLASFKTASKYPFTTGLSQWAEGPDGSSSTKFPFVLCLQPTNEVRSSSQEFKNAQFEHVQEQLDGLYPQKIVYDIYAASEPRTLPIKIGHVKLQTKFHKTKFGDNELFYRHDWFEKDLELKPEWQEIVDEPDFWFEEGAAHFYKTIDPGSGSTGDSGKNAWAGGYDPASSWQISQDAKSLQTWMQGESMLESDGGEQQ